MHIPIRNDTNAVRNLRRGSIEDAISALDQLGLDALTQYLLKDRVAASGVAVNCSLLKTWHTLHESAYRLISPMVPVLPLTPSSLVVLGLRLSVEATGPSQTISQL